MIVPRVLSILAVACLILMSPINLAEAVANGRPPGTTGLVAAPAGGTAPEGQTLMLGLTFGLGISHDGGKNFHWVCEEAIGGATGVDFLLAAPSANTLVTGSSKGLFISRDGGCDWQPVAQFAAPAQVSALAVDPVAPEHWYVTVNVPADNRGFVYASHDSGVHWRKLPVGHDGVYLYSIALAHGQHADKQLTLAVAGSNNGAHDSCLLMTSHDGGKAFMKQVVKGAPAASATPTVAMHPHEANTWLVTALDITTNGSVVLGTLDGGRTFRQLGRIEEPVRSIAFEGAHFTALIATTGHVWQVHEDGTMAALPSPQNNACLGHGQNALWLCGSSADHRDGFALATSQDGGHTLTKALLLTDLKGPQCPQDSSSQKACAALWANQQTAIAAAAHADPAAEFIASEQGPAAAAPTLSATADPAAPATPKAQGCRCDMGPGGNTGLIALLWAPLIAYRVRHRLRRR